MKTRQCSKTERNLLFWTWWPSSQRNSQTCEEKIGKTFGSSHAVQKARTSTTKVAAKEEIASKNIHQNDLRLYCGIPWVHQATSGIFATHNIWRSHCRQRFHFDDPLQFGSHIYSNATCDENSGCKSFRGQGMEEARDNSSMGFGKNREQEGGYSRSKRKSILLHWWTYATSKNAE